MKRLYLVAGLLAATFSMNLPAQVMEAQGKVPFDFWVGEKLMPAGTYSVYRLATGAILLQGGPAAAWSGAVFLPQPLSRMENSETGKLEFTQYGNTCFLSEIWNPYQKEGYRVPKSSKEKELARRTIPAQTTGFAVATK